MLSKVFSAAILGLDAQLVEVEVNASFGLRHFEIAENYSCKSEGLI